jgi:predicted ATPase
VVRVRSIESLELVLGQPLTVLIGENGAGKSTILECLELLRNVGERDFVHRFHTVHRGMPGMLRAGATSLELGRCANRGRRDARPAWHTAAAESIDDATSGGYGFVAHWGSVRALRRATSQE